MGFCSVRSKKKSAAKKGQRFLFFIPCFVRFVHKKRRLRTKSGRTFFIPCTSRLEEKNIEPSKPISKISQLAATPKQDT